jgi:Protein NO VEIN, C-terminal/Domain of unknown function (DUF3427)
MKNLTINETYSRQEVHGIFSPETKFTPSSGTWGLQGLVKIPGRKDDFVFFVTYGQQQGEHIFDEGVSEGGVLRWQSQPKQGFDNAVIQSLIHHDDTKNNIYLFLRGDKSKPYQYLGKLKYLTHDNTREKPVYFQWQILRQSNSLVEPHFEIQKNILLRESNERPKSRGRQGTSKQKFQSRTNIDYAERDKNNREVGLAGEQLVMEYEIKRLSDKGHTDLARKVTHVSVIEGDGAGYDIRSYEEDGTEMYIEVKATRGNINTEFFMSPNEVLFSKKHKAQYYLYRLFDLKATPQFFKLHGDICDYFNATPTGFKMAAK